MICILAGCSSASTMNPVNWWHRAEGGKIAEQRPAPPGVDQPYPNLSTVPAKPTPPDMAELKKLTDSLIADRTNAQHAAQAAPLADPSMPSASPTLFGVGTAPPPPPTIAPMPAAGASATPRPPASEPGVARASMPAVAAPPPPPAPRKPVASAPLTAPALPPETQTAASAAPAMAPAMAPAVAPTTQAPPPPASAAMPAAPAAPEVAAPATAAAQPALPEAPPARPAAAGPAPVVASERPPMPAPVRSATAASIVFVEGSTSLSQPAADEVKVFAGKRGNSVIVVTGYGDAASSDPAAQSAALTVGLARAAAVAEALKADGVPANAVRVNAEASGRGASLRLLQ